MGLDCFEGDCYIHSRCYFATIFVCLFSLNIWEIMKPRIQYFLQSGSCNPDVQEENEEDRLSPIKD